MAPPPYVLGFASTPWEQSKGTWYDTHLGGVAVWPNGLELDIAPCPLCNTARLLVLQAFAPHHNHAERAIYVFGCNKITCSSEASTWCALRVCRVRDPPKCAGAVEQGATVVKPEHGKQEEIDWDSDSESDSKSDEDLVDELELLSLEVNLATAKREAASQVAAGIPRDRTRGVAKRARARTPAGAVECADAGGPSLRGKNGAAAGLEKPSTEASSGRAFEALFVEVDYEPDASACESGDAAADDLLQKYREEEKTLVASGAKETFAAEDDGDLTEARVHFDSFQERISRAPSQLLRYMFGGNPLWPKPVAPTLTTARCVCNAPLVFELQLLGSCLHYLQPEKSVPDHQEEAGMNFASLAVFTCAEDCTREEAMTKSSSFKVISQAVCIQKDDW